MVVRLHIYSKEKLYPSEGSGQDRSPTPLAETARIAHHSETNIFMLLYRKKINKGIRLDSLRKFP